MPQLEQIATYVSQLFWLAVMFSVVYFTLARVALPKVASVLQNRRETIDGDLQKANQLTGDAQAVEKAYLAAIAEVRAQALDVTVNATKESKKAADARYADLNALIVGKTAEADKRIKEIRSGAMKEISGVSSELAREIAERIAGVKVSSADSEQSVEKLLKQKVA